MIFQNHFSSCQLKRSYSHFANLGQIIAHVLKGRFGLWKDVFLLKRFLLVRIQCSTHAFRWARGLQGKILHKTLCTVTSVNSFFLRQSHLEKSSKHAGNHSPDSSVRREEDPCSLPEHTLADRRASSTCGRAWTMRAWLLVGRPLCVPGVRSACWSRSLCVRVSCVCVLHAPFSHRTMRVGPSEPLSYANTMYLIHWNGNLPLVSL